MINKKLLEQIAARLGTPDERGILNSYYWAEPRMNRDEEESLIVRTTPYNVEDFKNHLAERTTPLDKTRLMSSDSGVFCSPLTLGRAGLLRTLVRSELFSARTSKRKLFIDILAQDMIKAASLSGILKEGQKLRGIAYVVGQEESEEDSGGLFLDDGSDFLRMEDRLYFSFSETDYEISVRSYREDNSTARTLLHAYFLNLTKNIPQEQRKK